MKALFALIKREYLEHRGAFVIAPIIILLVLAAVMLAGVTFGRVSAYQKVAVMTGAKGFEIGFLVLCGLWLLYLLAALVFYFADAFSADSRNNAMLFWKSMPVSDFGILGSKFLSGATILPALILLAMLLSGVIVYVGTVIMAFTVPGFQPVPVGDLVAITLNVFGFAAVTVAVGFAWYAPFFAWVGLLSTLFRRWAIPLGFLIPALLGIAESVILRDTTVEGGYVLGYLRERIKLPLGHEDMLPLVFGDQHFSVSAGVARLAANIDWTQLLGGLGVALVFVYIASEYRRRSLAN